MANLYNNIVNIFNKDPNILFEISNIDFSEYKQSYKCALVFVVLHAELLSINNYKDVLITEKYEPCVILIIKSSFYFTIFLECINAHFPTVLLIPL